MLNCNESRILFGRAPVSEKSKNDFKNQIWLKTTTRKSYGEPILSWYLLLKNQFRVTRQTVFKFVTNKFHLIATSAPSIQTQSNERERQKPKETNKHGYPWISPKEFHGFVAPLWALNAVMSPNYTHSQLHRLLYYMLLHCVVICVYECEITLTIINNCSRIIVIIIKIECIYYMMNMCWNARQQAYISSW